MLEEVGDPGLAVDLVGAADLVDDELVDDRRTAGGQDDDLQAVGQGEALDAPRLDGEKLGVRNRRRGESAGRDQATGQGAAARYRCRTQKMPSSKPRLRRVMVGVAVVDG